MTIIIDVRSNKITTKLQGDIDKIVKFTKINDYTSELRIDNIVYCSVYKFDPKDIRDFGNHEYFGNSGRKKTENNRTKKFISDDVSRGKSTRLYSCMNCKFAVWIRMKIFNLIERVQLLYNKVFKTNFDNVFETEFENDGRINDIIEYVKRFADILFNFLSAYDYKPLFDTSLLKSMVSFQFKIDSINTTKMSSSSNVMIATMLEMVNATHNYEALYCNVPSAFYDNKRYYGFSIDTNESIGNEDVDAFLIAIKPLELENSSTRCRVRQMLLKDIVSAGDIVSRDLNKIPIHLSCSSKRLSIEQIYEKIRHTVDLQMILWYQSMVFDALMQILCIRVKHVTVENLTISNYQLVEKLRVLDFLYSDYSVLPQDVVDSFKRLVLYDVPSEDKRSALSAIARYQTGYVSRHNNDNPVTPAFSLMVHEKQFKVGTELEPFLDALISMENDYECFFRLFKLLHNAYDTYHMSHTKDTRSLKEFVENHVCGERATSVLSEQVHSVHVRNGCDLITDLYGYCFESLIALDNGQTQYPGTYRGYIKESETNIRSAMSLLSTLASTYDQNPFVKIALSLVPS